LAGANSPPRTIALFPYTTVFRSCTGASAFTNTKAASGNGHYQSDLFTPTQAGTYRWVTSYSGDANNNAVASACNAPNESVVVTAAPNNPPLTTNPSARSSPVCHV